MFLSDFQQICHNFADERMKLIQEIQSNQETISNLQMNLSKMEEAIRVLDSEAETQNKKVLELRNHLRSSTQEINYLRESTDGNLPANSNNNNINNVMRKSFDNTTSLSFGGGREREVSPSPKGVRERGRSNSGAGASVNNNTVNSKRSTSTGRFQFSTPFEDRGGERGGEQNYYHNSNNRLSPHSTQITASSIDHHSHSHTRLTTQSPARGTLALQSPVQWLHSFREDVQRAMDDGRCRLISLNECRELIHQIYESKTIANEKALQGVGNVPLESMEQHSFRVLEKKYGLRSLAVGHAGMLLKALECYAVEDNEVSVFQKIFRNEIEEDFRFVQEELFKSIKELTMVQIMGRNPLKDSQHLQQLLENKLNSGSICEDEWKDMINYLYNSADATTLGVLLKRQALLERDDGPSISAMTSPQGMDDNINNNNLLHTNLPGNTLFPQKVTRSNATYVMGTPNPVFHSQDAYQTGGQLGYDKNSVKDTKRLGYASPTLKIQIKDPKEQKVSRKDLLKLSFPVFMKIVLDFQLRSHMEYLANFLHLFRQFDRDVDGVLNGGEFKEFFHVLYQNTPRQNHNNNNNNNSPEQGLPLEYDEEEEELKTLLTLVKLIDPFQHDRFVFSFAVICLQKLQ
jgi:hypothetical protein